MQTLTELIDWLVQDKSGTAVGVFDATNTTMARRKAVIDAVRERDTTVKVLFLESLCSDESVLESNYRLKLSNKDYIGMSAEAALADFKARVWKYEQVYEPVEDDEDGGEARYEPEPY